jgi:hypothetical protein
MTNLRIYDNHLLDIMGFVPEFLKCVLFFSGKKKINQIKDKPDPFKLPRQENLILQFDIVNLTKIFDFQDILSLSFQNFEFVEDKVK